MIGVFDLWLLGNNGHCVIDVRIKIWQSALEFDWWILFSFSNLNKLSRSVREEMYLTLLLPVWRLICLRCKNTGTFGVSLWLSPVRPLDAFCWVLKCYCWRGNCLILLQMWKEIANKWKSLFKSYSFRALRTQMSVEIFLYKMYWL